MNGNPKKSQKFLLYFTGFLVAAFVFTWPTKDRRGMIDRIRLATGAEDLVSKQTLKQIAREKAASKRGPANVGAMAPRKMTGKGWTTVKENSDPKTTRAITTHCNERYNKDYCGQWLKYCGDSCKSLVGNDLWAKHMNMNKTLAATQPAKRKGR